MKTYIKLLGIALLTTTLAFTNIDKKVVVLDIGHGGNDPGLNHDGINEKDIAFSIAEKIKALSENSNIEIIFTRDTDNFVSLQDRVAMINSIKPDLTISLHVNSATNTEDRGVEIIVHNESNRSNELAVQLFNAYDVNKVQIHKQGLYYTLKNVESPIVMLGLGYITNDIDREQLTTEEGQSNIASTIWKAIQ